MKTAHIDQILNGRTYPTQKILDVASRIAVAPFIKLSDKTIIPENNDETPVRVAEFYCPMCEKKFTTNSEYTYEAECPYCNSKRASHVIHCVNYEIPLPFTAKMTVKLIDSSNYEWPNDRFHSSLIVNGEDSSYRRRALDVEYIFVVNKHTIDGKTYFCLAHCPINIAYDYINNKKELLISKSNSAVIISDTEIINIKDNRKSAASFLNTYSSYYSANSKYIIGEDDILKEFSEFFTNLCKDHLFYDPFTESPIEEFKYVNLNAFDALRDTLKSSNKTNKVYKKDLMAQEIIDNLQTPMSFSDTEKHIFFKITEKDEMNRTISGEFTCPFCHRTTVISQGDMNFFTNSSNFKECKHCHNSFEGIETINLSNINSADKYFCVIQDYEDGLVIRSILFKPVLTNNKLLYIPKVLDEKGENVIIINKTDGCSSDIFTLLSFNSEKGKYTFKKELHALRSIGSDRVVVEAKNMNAQWSGVEKLIKNGMFYHRKAQYEEDIIAKFLALYQKYPVLEQILKAGYKDIVFNIISSYDWYSDKSNTLYDLTKKDVASALRLSKGCLKYIMNINRRQVDDFKALQALYFVDNNITEEDFKYIISQNLPYFTVTEICENYGLTVHQVCEYIERVRVNQCVQPNTAISEWRDYLVAIKLIGSDLSDRRVKYPAALRTEHDKVVYKKKIIENADFEASFKKITKEYGEKYSYTGSNFIITYPKTLNDLFEEGRMLNHCVGTYGDAIKDGRSIILFVRKKKNPKNPYFTIEVNPTHRSISQFLGFNDLPPNRREDKELISFVRDWATTHGINY